MALNTNTYGYVIDPLFSFCDQGGKTIANGYVRVFRAGTSTPVLTYRNFDGAFNAETIELDNSGRTMTQVIASKGDLYKVCVYDAEHSQEDPILTVDKVAVIGSSVNATNIVQGLNDVAGSGWIKSVAADDTANVSLDATNVTSEVDTMVKATAASADYMMPLVHKTGSDPDKKITLGNIFKFVLNYIHSLTDTAAESDIASGNYFALDGSAGTKKLNSTTLLTKTAQNALAGNVASAFDPTRTISNPYKAGESVAYEGNTYTFKVDHYGAWNASNVYQRDVKKGVINPLSQSLDSLKLNKAIGKNLFNKDTKYKRAGCYIAYNNGYLYNNASYTAYVVPVTAGDTLSFNAAVNVAAFSVFPNLEDYSQYDKLIGYVTGISTAEQGWTVPAGVVCLVVSVYSSGTYQIEKGNASTSYEAYKEGVEADDVIGLASVLKVEEDKTDEKISKKLDEDVGKNLFNKDTANKKSGVYVTYNAGYMSTLSGWSAYVVDIPEGVTQVSISASGAHVCAFSSEPYLPTASGSIPGYLGGVTGESTQGWTLPEGTKCLVVSYADASIGGLQVESGASSTSYEAYKVGLEWSKVLNAPESKTLYVGAGQTYTTIQSAVNAANNGDTIFVFPGTYDEAVDCQTGGKFIRIVGFSRDSVVLTHSSANYYYPPLEIGKGVVENLTIKATGTTIDPDSGVASGAYCVHIDYNQESNSSLQFKNCKFTSELSPCVGIGLRSDFTLSFKGCEFVCTSGQSPVYCHEEQASNKTGQRIELIDCSISNEGNGETDSCVLLQETATLTGNEATILMQRCIMKRTYGAFDASNKAVKLRFYGAGTANGDGYLGSHLWKLDYMSELNSEAIANSSEQ